MNTQQDHILLHLYKFRFLNRNHIQQLLNHKQFNRIIIWLDQLTASEHIRRYYNPKTVTLPAVYSLGLKGRKYLKDNPELKQIKLTVLDRVWREHTLSNQFREHCLFIADCYLSLVKLVKTTGAKLHFYTKTDLLGLKYLILPHPDAYFSIEEPNGNKKSYFLDVFDELPARMVIRKRIRQYFQYFENAYWQDHNKNAFPAIILACPDTRSYNYTNLQIQKQLEQSPELSFYLSLRSDIKSKGLLREVLYKVKVEND